MRQYLPVRAFRSSARELLLLYGQSDLLWEKQPTFRYLAPATTSQKGENRSNILDNTAGLPGLRTAVGHAWRSFSADLSVQMSLDFLKNCQCLNSYLRNVSKIRVDPT